MTKVSRLHREDCDFSILPCNFKTFWAVIRFVRRCVPIKMVSNMKADNGAKDIYAVTNFLPLLDGQGRLEQQNKARISYYLTLHTEHEPSC